MIAARKVDSLVIGAGAAGMAAAETIARQGFGVVLVDREEHMGGILHQCIHDGFGLHHFGKELTGPEYAEIFSDRVRELHIETFLETTVVDLVPEGAGVKAVTCSARHGVTVFEAATVVCAMGSRERNRGNIAIAGTRPAGVFTAGLAQRLINVEGIVPGKRAVIIGSGDIGLIMARRLTLTGSEVAAVIEILPHPSGLTRNIVQCLQDFSIPLYLSHAVTEIGGKDRVESVRAAPLENGIPDGERSFTIPCDTVLLSVGLIPENELSRRAGVEINPNTGGPVVDNRLQTGLPGVFACGNVLHIHDLVDFATQEAQHCGAEVVEYLRGNRDPHAPTVPVETGPNLKYVVPNRWMPAKPQHFFMRSLVVKEKAELEITRNGATVMKRTLSHVRPAEMISLHLPAQEKNAYGSGAPLTFSLR